MWTALALVAGLAFAIWLLSLNAKRVGAASAREKALSEAFKRREAMDRVKPPGESGTLDSLRDGEF